MNLKEAYIETFQENFNMAERQAKSLQYSIAKISIVIVPLSNIDELSDIQKEVLDAFLLRYAKFEDFLFKRVLRSLAKLEGFKFQKSETDQLMQYMYQKNILPEPDFWLKQAALRNTLIHEYPYDAEEQIDAIKKAFESTPILLDILKKVETYAIYALKG